MCGTDCAKKLHSASFLLCSWPSEFATSPLRWVPQLQCNDVAWVCCQSTIADVSQSYVALFRPRSAVRRYLKAVKLGQKWPPALPIGYRFLPFFEFSEWDSENMDKVIYVLCAVSCPCWSSGQTACIIIISPEENWYKCKQTPFNGRGSKSGPVVLTVFCLSLLFQKLRLPTTYFQIHGEYCHVSEAPWLITTGSGLDDSFTISLNHNQL
jgi:hypothetical protein